ncbi:MAG: ABC-2 type transport system ATP-binding protein [Pseudohongiellaceae bacterium]|jgi:ABC-2 type transport system ATP-binding protein
MPGPRVSDPGSAIQGQPAGPSHNAEPGAAHVEVCGALSSGAQPNKGSIGRRSGRAFPLAQATGMMVAMSLPDNSSSSPAPAIELRGVTRRFGDQLAVDNLDLVVEPGQVFGFLGPNGAGKTTTVRMLCGLLRPSAGQLAIHGHDVTAEADTVRRLIGLVPDTPPLYEHLTGWQYAAFVASLYDVPRDQRDADIERLFAQFELDQAAHDLCRGYSFGMRKKLHIAAVLTTRPQVLFLDEPTTGLDPRSARHLVELISATAQQGTTVLLTTHLLHLAQQLCPRVGILARGRLLAEGPVDQLLARRGDSSLEDVFLHLTEEQDEPGPADLA